MEKGTKDCTETRRFVNQIELVRKKYNNWKLKTMGEKENLKTRQEGRSGYKNLWQIIYDKNLEINIMIFVITISINGLDYAVKKAGFLWLYLLGMSPVNLNLKAKEKSKMYQTD